MKRDDEVLERRSTPDRRAPDRQSPGRRVAIDFHSIRPGHEPIHERLLNWARYVCSSGQGNACQPMFRMFRSTYLWGNYDAGIPVDTLDGSRLEKAVGMLPEHHAAAVRWHYVYSTRGVSVYKACRVLAVRQDTLAQLVHDGRSMLRNRGT